DSTMALAIFGYALTLGVLPSLPSLPNLPGFDFEWLLRHDIVRTLLIVFAIIGVVAVAVWIHARVADFKARAGQASRGVRPKRRCLRRVAFCQACDWSLRSATIWCFLGAFHVPQTARNVLLVQVTQSLATLAPVTPGGIGTEQAFLVYVFG